MAVGQFLREDGGRERFHGCEKGLLLFHLVQDLLAVLPEIRQRGMDRRHAQLRKGADNRIHALPLQFVPHVNILDTDTMPGVLTMDAPSPAARGASGEDRGGSIRRILPRNARGAIARCTPAWSGHGYRFRGSCRTGGGEAGGGGVLARSGVKKYHASPKSTTQTTHVSSAAFF